MNLFTASKRLTSILAVLAGFGIQAEDEKTDIAAAIQGKIDEAKGSTDVAGAVQAALTKEREAHAATTAVLREKAEMFDALEKQATESGLDLRAMAKGDSLAETLDSKTREQAKKILGQNAPESIAADPGPDAAPTGLKGEAVARHYQSLIDADKKAEAEAYYSLHSDEILAHANLTLSTSA